MESVDYTDTFITVAPDSTAAGGTIPPGETVAALTYRVIIEHPYALRSSEVIFGVWAARRALPADAREAAWADFYANPGPVYARAT